MALLQPGDLFPNGTASISFTSGSGITITPFSQSGDAYVVFETDLINYPNTTQYLEGATFTEKTNSLGDVVDGSGYRAGIFTYPGSSFVFTPSVDIPEGRVLIKSTGNIGLDVASFIGLLNLYPGAAAAYSLRKLDADYTGSAVEIRRDVDNASSSFSFTSTGELDTSSILNFVNVTETLPADYGSGAAAAYSLRKVRENYTGNLIEVRRSSDNASGSFGFDSNGDLDTASLLSFVNEEITDNINTTTDSNADGLADGLSKLTNNPTATIVTGNGHIGSAQRMEYNVGAGNLQSIGINTLSTMIGQEITVSFMYRSNISFSLGNGNGSAGGDFNSIPANTGDAIRYEHKGVWSPAAGVDGRLQPMWLDASGEFIEISDWSVTYHTADGHIKTWYDQSGNNNNATQSTPGSQPKIVNTGSLVTDTNGKPAVGFDGVDDELDISVTITSGFSFFGIYKNTKDGSYLLGSSNAQFGRRGTSEYRFHVLGSFSANGGVHSNSQVLFTGIEDTTNATIYANGTQQAQAPSIFSSDTLTLISRLNVLGNIQEVIIYNSDQSSNRPSIEANINSYYSIYTPTTNGFVKTWYDQSGNSNDATQATPGSQPLIVSSGSMVVENGKPAVGFDGTKELVSTGLSGSTIQDTYFVMKYTSGGDPERMSMYDLYSNATNRYSFYADSGDGGIAFSNYGSPILYKNSSLQTITNRADVYTSLVTNSQILRVDQNANTSTWQDISFGFWFNSFGYIGTLQEWIIYPSDQSANRVSLETNINTFYSIYSP